MTDLTPRDDIKKKVSEILKRVDQLLKAGDLAHAAQQLAQAKEIDPKNVYIFAYEERMEGMFKERKEVEIIEAKRKSKEEETKKGEEKKRKIEGEKRLVQNEVRSKMEGLRREQEEERRREEEAKEKRREEVQKKKEAEEEPKEGGPRKAEISRNVLEETRRKILDERKKRGAPDLNIHNSKTFHHAHAEGLNIYRRVMVEVWADGAATRAEEERLESLRASLMITPEDHLKLERDAKHEAYSNAFRRAWSSGAISPESASSLVELRKKYKINIEEHEQIETKLLWELRSSSQKAQLLVIDDDEKLLHLLSDTLQDAGYQAVAFTTSDEAFSFLQSNTPDIIVSDINLETSTMGGFTFYEKVREIERLHEIPFIFLSGLTDEVLIRTGKELGVDDYITKPFSEENLLATIKGKLKRYRQLRKSRQKK
jgi:CheY-like chemotaxis protein